MSFNEGRIVLDSPNGTYYSGQTVRGNLIFQQDTVKTIRGLYLKFHGYCKVHWTTTESYTVNGKTRTRTVNHDSYEEYVNTKVYLVGGESGEHPLQAGHYNYQFTFQLPANCPSSFEGAYGHIRYKIKAVVDRPLKFNQDKKVAVRVMAPLNLNMNPYSRAPIEMELNGKYYCCCFRRGSTSTVINAPMSGYCPGQKIPIEVVCTNTGKVDISHVKLKIMKKVVFIATHRPGRREDREVVAEIKKDSVPRDTTRNWNVEMEVPAQVVYNLSACSYIELHYKLKVIVSPGGCHRETHDSRKIIIGTIPLVGFQDNVPNAIYNQTPQEIGSIIQQPYPSVSFPGVYPIQPNPVGKPDGNPPYTGVNVSYPENPPSYPGTSTYPPDQKVTPGKMDSESGNMNSGTIGFTVSGDSNMHSMPYPGTLPASPLPVKPYMTASSTETNVTDAEKKKEKE